METIRNWVIGVTFAAMLIAIADSITPSGTVKKLGKLTCGLVLMIAVISPLVGVDYEAFSAALTESRAELTGYSAQEAVVLNAQLMKTIIAEQTAAYILDKAIVLGADCAVEVTCHVNDQNLPYPAAVTVTGTLTESQRKELSRSIEADLAIPADMQTFESGDVE